MFGINALRESEELIINQNKEIIQAIKFNNTIVDSEWFKYRSISPGGGAVDYAFLYTLFRVLNMIKPNNILEFGLGQSSKVIHQYANFNNGKSAITVEHDKDWIDCFVNSKEGDYQVRTKQLDLEYVIYKGIKTLSYHNCHKTFEGHKFDLVLVDGPFGFEPNTHYSRSQIIDIAKDCLSPDFVIIIDDYDRLGEQETAQEVMQQLSQKRIPYFSIVFGGIKKHMVIASSTYKFISFL